MLYHFPNESVDDFEKSEANRLSDQIKKASRVQTHGYRKQEPVLPSFQVESLCVNGYLGCKINNWSWPKSLKEKVRLEPLPTEFLPPIWRTNKPLQYIDPETNELVHRVVGFREIQRKREYLEYLQDVEDDGWTADFDFDEEDYETTSGVIDGIPRPAKDLPSNLKVEISLGGGDAAQENGKPRKSLNPTRKSNPEPVENAKKKSNPKPVENATRKSNQEQVENAKRKSSLETKEAEGGQTPDEPENKALPGPEGTEREDDEWLDLSDTNIRDQHIHPKKKKILPWMQSGISYESQLLVKRLRVFNIFTKIVGRGFLHIAPDKDKGHMNFTHKKKKRLIAFFTTTMLCWVCFSLIIVSLICIRAETIGPPERKQGSSPLTKEELAEQYDVAVSQFESLQLMNYEIPFYFFLCQLAFVSLASVLILLVDGTHIAHYLNCWCAALADMETSGSLGIAQLIIWYHIVWIVPIVILVPLWVLKFPAHFWESNLLIMSLVVRPFVPSLGLNEESVLLWYRLAGFALQAYVYYCAMLLKLFMAIVSRVIKNTSERWNFQFALTFRQLATNNRGQLIRIALNESLVKMFQHHRILTVLLRNFGEVFMVPLVLYHCLECELITLTCVRWFLDDPEGSAKFYKEPTVLAKTYLRPPDHNFHDVTIYNYHPQPDVHFMYLSCLIMLLVQFILTTEILAFASTTFFAGFEFVRRIGTLLCDSSHQRRLIQSLEWSFSSTNPSILSVSGYYPLSRETIFSALVLVVGLFALIIQLRPEAKYYPIVFNDPKACLREGMDTLHGRCIENTRLDDYSLNFADVQPIFERDLQYWPFPICLNFLTPTALGDSGCITPEDDF